MKTSSALAMLARHAGRLSSSSFAGMITETGILDELDVIIECLNLNAVEFWWMKCDRHSRADDLSSEVYCL
ncbi:hypothetical protein NDA07_11330 [Microcoleus vaginatus DQ-U2]|uniref:hypothetical protein n=1 Tax=Microcoleus vaginatus TaxID=119532 RepID=UPI0032A5C698